jgi:hypothetical protein
MEIKNIKIYGLPESIIRSGYPHQIGEPEDLDNDMEFLDEFLEPGGLKRVRKLASTPSGSGHNNFLKGIIVQFDLKYPEYFSPQLQRYHWIDIISSQSKMHKITSRELTKEDFTKDTNIDFISTINVMIKNYSELTDINDKNLVFNQIISSLPSGYMKWMGISTNYLQLKTIWNQRCKCKHKLDEWRIFGEFIQSLPMSELIIEK